jgi:hypothetical protein
MFRIMTVSKTRAFVYIDQVVSVICIYKSVTIRMPTSEEGWRNVQAGFEGINGFPNVVGAMDASLIEIIRLLFKPLP